MCSGGIDKYRFILYLVKLNGDRVRWKNPLSLNGNSRRMADTLEQVRWL